MPQSRVQTSLTLFGGAPWGFRISGGKEFNQPIVVTRVTPGSLASKSGVASGDVLIAINNQYVSQMTQDECEVAVKQAVGSLHLVLEKNAATVTELPGGQFKVEGDRSVYTAVKDQQQRLSKFNRRAKPFGAPDAPASPEKNTEAETSESKPGFRPVAFKPKPQTSTGCGMGETSGVADAAESLSTVSLQASETQAASKPANAYDPSKYNRKISPFPGSKSANANNSNNSFNDVEDYLPPPPDFVLNAEQSVASPSQKYASSVSTVLTQPKSIIARKVIASQSLGLYSKANVGDVYDNKNGGQ